MGLLSFNKTAISDASTTRFQDNVARIFQALLPIPILNGQLLEDVILIAGNVNRVSHGLDRPYRGWIVVKKRPKSVSPSTALYFWDTDAPATDKATILQIWTSDDATISLWVF